MMENVVIFAPAPKKSNPPYVPDWADEIASKIPIDDYQYDCAKAIRVARAEAWVECEFECFNVTAKYPEDSVEYKTAMEIYKSLRERYLKTTP